MNGIKRILTTSMALLLVAGFCLPLRAEVSAGTDRSGKYVTTRLTLSENDPTGEIWTAIEPERGTVRVSALNPHGDEYGDQWPTIVENVVAPHHPWVIWSRFNGQNYDLAWSRWSTRGWDPVRWVEQNATAGDDLDADLVFNQVGRPYVVWSRESEDGRGQVFLSLFLESRWMDAFPISDPGIDARYPTIEVLGPRRMQVEFETPFGSMTQMVYFNRPVTITDDINPQMSLSLNGEPVVFYSKD